MPSPPDSAKGPLDHALATIAERPRSIGPFTRPIGDLTPSTNPELLSIRGWDEHWPLFTVVIPVVVQVIGDVLTRGSPCSRRCDRRISVVAPHHISETPQVDSCNTGSRIRTEARCGRPSGLITRSTAPK